MYSDSQADVPPAARAAALVMTLGLGLAGCHPDGQVLRDLASGDGVPCGSVADAPAVYVDVDYDASGMPRVNPDTCEIASGTTVTWRGPDATPVPFEVRFKQASPVPDGGREPLMSSEVDARYKVTRKLAGAGTYPYGVTANGKTLDPAIIIR